MTHIMNLPLFIKGDGDFQKGQGRRLAKILVEGGGKKGDVRRRGDGHFWSMNERIKNREEEK